MSLPGRNSSYANVHRFGDEQSRPYGSSPNLLACRICDKIFLSPHSLIEHYESHQDELARRREDHLRTLNQSSQRERRDGNSTNNSFQSRLAPSATLQQRYHPYYPNGYRVLQQQQQQQQPQQVRERNPVTNANPYLASSQNPSLIQPRNPAAQNSTSSVPSLNSLPGRSSFANTKPFFINQPSHISPPKFCSSATSNSASTSQTVPSPKIPEQKGLSETEDKGTIWYLGQLERPIPKVIDLEADVSKHGNIKLDLELKL